MNLIYVALIFASLFLIFWVQRTQMGTRPIRWGVSLVALGAAGFLASQFVAAQPTSQRVNLEQFTTADTSRIKVTQSQLGDLWPLLMAEAEVECVQPGMALILHTPDGKSYALNGMAREKGLPTMESVTARDRHIPAARMNLQPLMDIGFRLCK